MVGVISFFPLFTVFLAMVTGFAMGTSLAGAVVTVSWVVEGSSRLSGFNPMAVMLVVLVPKGGTSYQTGNVNTMLANTRVSKTCWETKLARG